MGCASRKEGLSSASFLPNRGSGELQSTSKRENHIESMPRESSCIQAVRRRFSQACSNPLRHRSSGAFSA